MHIVAARFQFGKCLMKHESTYKDWVAELRGLTRKCNYMCSGESCNNSYVDKMIRDQIILHTPHDAVRAAALQKTLPTLAEVLLIAESYEATSKTVATIKFPEFDAEILKPVQFSEWASPIVLAKKPDGSVRICADFKATVNPQIDVEQYPLPLRETSINMLRRKDVPFRWGTEQNRAFMQLKNLIIKATELAHYREDLQLHVAADASSYGIGAVLSHILADGSEKPIAFASKTLDQHQVKYSQIEKEALAIVFAVQRFHQYIYSRKFILVTDHKPLVSIFHQNKQLPVMTANRLQRWAIILMGYQYDIKYRSTKEHANADALSQLPLGPDVDFDKQEWCNNVEEMNLPINHNQIQKHAASDYLYNRVKKFVSEGWPIKLKNGELMPYFTRKLQLTIEQGLLCLQGNATRVIIPKALQKIVLRLLHEGHWGVIKMKQLARQHCWWVGIDKDIEREAAKCTICCINSASPKRTYASWPTPEAPWDRIHIDFAGPVFNAMWLICVDAFSQFPYIICLFGTTSAHTIIALKSIFAIEGLPKCIVSDNEPQLTSEMFRTFCYKNGVKHITTAPFHPASFKESRCDTKNQNNQENNIQPEELTWQTISSQGHIPEPEKSAVNPSNAFEELRRSTRPRTPIQRYQADNFLQKKK
ncbi:uncharacterized protein K02A2.6-like [Teleopsis dalmanni]|uniref:uncharacterized protein K02A2.6-like n=1 Tax=Teleopsis dalmanni TaxID=139649 RepID=UPI0018CFD69D|nr:uncharacterized protein K02A2.6-like [Teleopsis dalmanni]